MNFTYNCIEKLKSILASVSKDIFFSLFGLCLQFSKSFRKFYGQEKHGENIDAVDPSKDPRGSHQNCITY